MKNLVEQAERGEIPDRQAVQRIELQTAETLTSKLAKAVEKGKLEKRADLVGDVQEHLDAAVKASGDNRRLREAIEAVKKHTKILENVKEKVSGPAKEAIQRAIEQSKIGLRKLREITQEKGPGRGSRENVPRENRERIKALKKQAGKAMTKFQEKIENLESKREKIENWYESRKEKLTEKFEKSRENWKENIEDAEKRFEEKFDRIERRKEEKLENLENWRERILERFEKRTENILEHIEEGKKLGKLENFAPGISDLLENRHWFLENKEKGRHVGPPEKILERVKKMLERKHERLEQRLENRFRHMEKQMERRKRILENRVDKLEDKYGERFDKLSEKLDGELQKLREKREKKIGKLEEKKQKAKERLEKRLRKIARKLERILPKKAVADNVLRSILENEGLPPSLLEPKPEGKSVPFIHRGGKPPWAGPPEFAPENETGWDNINFEIPENQEKTENEETGAYQLMGPELPDHSVSYSINPANGEGVDKPTAITEIKAAFETWDDHTSKELFSDEVSTTTKSGFEQDGTNTISFAPLDVDTAAASNPILF
ncbi:hypothetical protein AKJ41_00205 [candidate division MSBL1 archaeon SCGC-AAA259O05]|uniref:Uncharacterized protein n=1 Tax=candidate division MSBL1 archaeon SCGC-AAA259O05 TaxID=1698271 RepID=A0A133V5V7_9EURY|nr:hypothetical protein AKJ41_00205 [candidate division MSBL1 archaeon SCGC-AAA259O05]